MDYVLVGWRDSNTFGGWRNARLQKELVTEETLDCASVGFLLVDEEDRIVLAQSLSFTGKEVSIAKILSVSECLAIPKGCVVSINKLGEVDLELSE